MPPWQAEVLSHSEEPNVEGPGAMLAKQNEVFTDLSAEQIGGKQLRLGWFAGCAPSQHYTMLFNAFVMMTLFNQFASRKLNGENNIFETLFTNDSTAKNLIKNVIVVVDKNVAPGTAVGDISLVQRLLKKDKITYLIVHPEQPLGQKELEIVKFYF